LSFCPGRKVTTRRAEIGISSPVFRVAPGALVLVTQIEIAEAGQLHLLVVLEADANLLEEQLDDLLGLALVQPELLEEPFDHIGLGKSRHTCAPAVFAVAGAS
jgi:hypothetical protein